MPLPVAPFDASKSLFSGLSIIQLKIKAQVTGVTAATDTLTKTAHGYRVGDQLQFVSGTGFTGLTAGTNYFVSAVPSADTFKISADVDIDNGVSTFTAALSVGTSSVGIFQPVEVFEVEKLDQEPNEDYAIKKRPGRDGKLRVARRLVKEENETFTFGLDEVRRLPRIFNGKLHGLVNALATIWMPDAEDSASSVALKSEDDFACNIRRDGTFTAGGGDFSSCAIKLESTEDDGIDFIPDATV